MYLLEPTDTVNSPLASPGSETETVETTFSVRIVSFKPILIFGTSKVIALEALEYLKSPLYVKVAV